jgi:hypothetical protein
MIEKKTEMKNWHKIVLTVVLCEVWGMGTLALLDWSLKNLIYRGASVFDWICLGSCIFVGTLWDGFEFVKGDYSGMDLLSPYIVQFCLYAAFGLFIAEKFKKWHKIVLTIIFCEIWGMGTFILLFIQGGTLTITSRATNEVGAVCKISCAFTQAIHDNFEFLAGVPPIFIQFCVYALTGLFISIFVCIKLRTFPQKQSQGKKTRQI